MVEIEIGVLAGQCRTVASKAIRASPPKSPLGRSSAMARDPHRLELHNRKGPHQNGASLCGEAHKPKTAARSKPLCQGTAMSEQILRLSLAVLASAHEQSVPIFQQLARGHPSGRDDVRAIPAVASKRRGSLAERGSTLATRPSGSGGIGSAQCSPPRIRRRRVADMRGYPQWRWHLDEVFVKVNGKLCYLWRAVDHDGEVLEAVVTAKRTKPQRRSSSSGS